MTEELRWVAFRLFVYGRMVDQRMILADAGALSAVGDIAIHQGELAAAAEAAGRPYMVEVEFSDGDHVRWGTDVNGMVIPMAVGLDGLMAAMAKRYAT
jgi:hypothetical protein